MFYVIRFTQSNNGISCKYTEKSFDSFKKAVAYCHRYSYAKKFISCDITDDKGELLAIVTKNWKYV